MIRLSSEQLQMLFNKMSQGIIYLDSSEKIIAANPAAINVMGIKLEEAVNKTFIDLHLKAIHEDGTDFSLKTRPAAICLREGKEVKNVIMGVYNFSNNNLKWLNISSVPLFRPGRKKPYQVFVTFEDVTLLKRKEKEIEDSLREKDTLLKEIHHRVKNNLQIIQSILNLQSDYISNPELSLVLEECQDRIRTMSIVHECLYQSKNLSKVNMHEYINKIIEYLHQAYSPIVKSITIISDIEYIETDLTIATYFGIVLNELITNSLKHAFRGLNEGQVKVSIGNDVDFYKLSVSDNGIGFPKGVNLNKTKTFGLRLVELLIEQLKGRLKILPGRGTNIQVIFPKTR